MTTSTDTTLAHERYLELFTADSAQLAAAAGRDLAAAVPYCDGWLVRDLVGHAGSVWGHKATVIAERWPVGSDEAPPHPPPPGADDDVIAWYDAQRARLLDAFDGARPDDKVWTWADGYDDVRFWGRRMAQEALIHRVDAEAAVGEAPSGDPDLVVDGIDEVLGPFLTSVGRWIRPGGTGEVVRFVTAGHEWRSTVGAEQIGFARGPGAAAATVSGEPMPLLLWLWGRAPDDSVAVEGDAALVGRLKTLLREATQ